MREGSLKPHPELPKKTDDPEQSRRFNETAKKLGADKGAEEFERSRRWCPEAA
jgi:hypothetical protein